MSASDLEGNSYSLTTGDGYDEANDEDGGVYGGNSNSVSVSPIDPEVGSVSARTGTVALRSEDVHEKASTGPHEGSAGGSANFSQSSLDEEVHVHNRVHDHEHVRKRSVSSASGRDSKPTPLLALRNANIQVSGSARNSRQASPVSSASRRPRARAPSPIGASIVGSLV